MPIEVAPGAYAPMLERLKKMGSPNAALRMAKMKAGPVVTDNGNFVIDAPFSEEDYKNPMEVSKDKQFKCNAVGRDQLTSVFPQLLVKLKLLTGVVEVGLFCGMAKVAYFGNEVPSLAVKLQASSLIDTSGWERKRPRRRWTY